jgi:hypothetical protein
MRFKSFMGHDYIDNPEPKATHRSTEDRHFPNVITDNSADTPSTACGIPPTFRQPFAEFRQRSRNYQWKDASFRDPQVHAAEVMLIATHTTGVRGLVSTNDHKRHNAEAVRKVARVSHLKAAR